MKLIYTSENPVLVAHVQNLLEQCGLQVQLRNRFAAGAAGELPAFHTWPELWLAEEDSERGASLLKSMEQATPAPPWRCSRCHEENGGEFDCCWKCLGQISA